MRIECDLHDEVNDRIVVKGFTSRIFWQLYIYTYFIKSYIWLLCI